MYTHQNLDYGFVILSLEHNPRLVSCTTNSIRNRYPDTKYICITEQSVCSNDIRELKHICPTYRGKNTVTSLINSGMKHAPAEWNIFVMAGVTLRNRIPQKYSYFIEDEKDIVFPIADGKTNFIDGTINGLMIHKKTFKEIGPLEDIEDMSNCKAVWAAMALVQGCRFKAIAGCKLC